MTPGSSAEEAIKDIRRATRRHWSAEDKIRIVLEGLRDAILAERDRIKRMTIANRRLRHQSRAA